VFLKRFLSFDVKFPLFELLEVSLKYFYQILIIFGTQVVCADDMVSNVFNVEDAVSRFKLEAVEMEPVVGREFIVIEVESETDFIFINVFFALSAGASVGFSVLNNKVLSEVTNIFFHQSTYTEGSYDMIGL
jgi:hypothetical protein